ncbi:MAG: phospholipase D-like domain-containing protein [Sandaracinaceae bacterium]
MNLQEVLIPARRFEVEIVLGPHDGLSLIEQYIVRAIALGARTVESVAGTLALPDRLVLEAGVDLLSRGLIEVRADGSLGANDRLLQAMGDPATPTKDWFLAFQSARVPEPRTVTLVQDLVAGEVFSLSHGPLNRERLPAMPQNERVPALADIPLAGLVTAVTSRLRAERLARNLPKADDLRDTALPRDARILNVRLARAAAEGSGAVTVRAMWILARVAVTERGANEPPRVTIVEPNGLSPQVRRSIRDTLDDLWIRGYARGPGQFFARIEASAEEAEEERPRFAAASNVVQHMRSLLSQTIDDHATTHRELSDLELTVADTAEQLATYWGDASLIVGTAATFRDAALEALREAKNQVVLACPWIGRMGRDPAWRQAIEGAVSRGVKVVVIWGIDDGLPAGDDPSWQAVCTLVRGEWAGRVILTNRGARSHAKLIACDATWAVVSSCNFLNAAPERTRREVGVRVQMKDRVVPLALQTVLAWARRLIPDQAARDRCVDAPALFGLREFRPDLPIVRDPIHPPNPLFGNVGFETWRKAWDARIAELENVARATASVVPIYDGEHRDLLVRAIEQVRERLLVESHRVSPYGLTEPIFKALLAARARDVALVIRYGTDETLEPIARERLDLLAAAGAQIATLDTHAKILLHDDWAVVSSFNFLSADPGQRGAHELGLRVRHSDVVDALWHGTANVVHDATT